jgi:flagellar hook-associated protein 3 FlgL
MNMQTRVTGNMIANRVLNNLQYNLSRMGDLQEQMSSGKLLNRPSDSPTGTVSAMQLRTEMRRLEQYGRNSDDALSWLTTLDSTLNGVIPQVSKVRDLALAGMSAGTGGSAQGREALAAEVEAIRASLIASSNTSYLGRPVLGGTTAGPVAFNPDGSFAGNENPVMRTIGDGDPIQVDANGVTVLGAGSEQLFTVLQNVADNLRSNPAALAGDLTLLDKANNRVMTQLADIGARYNRVEQMKQSGADRLISLRSQLSEIEDIDLPATIMEMQMQESAYEAALGASAKVIQPSLMDFLR